MQQQTLPVKMEDLDGPESNEWIETLTEDPVLDGPEAKQILGERLYPLIEVEQGSLAGKITGMLLHGLDNSELVGLIDDQAALQSKIQEALAVLEAYHQTKVAPMVPVARTVQRAPLSRSQLEQSKLPPSPLRCATASSDLSTATTATASSDFSAPPQLMKRQYATPPRGRHCTTGIT